MTQRMLWRALLVLIALPMGSLLAPDPAAAHSGSWAQLYLADLRLEPARPAGWTVHAVLTDRGSGQPLPGFDVQVTGTSPSGQRFGPVTLRDPRSRGEYSAAITAEAGPWSITLDAKGFPGGAEGVPLRQKANVNLTPAVSARAATAASADSGRGSSGSDPLRWAVPPVLAVLVGGLTLAANRRRSVGVAR